MHGSYWWSIRRYTVIYNVTINNIFFYNTKQKYFMLPSFCSVVDEIWSKNVVRTSATHSALPRVPLFRSHHILTSSARDLSLNRRREAWNLFVKRLFISVNSYLSNVNSFFHVSYLLCLCTLKMLRLYYSIEHHVL